MTTIEATPTGLDTLVSPTSFPAANLVDITDIPAKYRALLVRVSGMSSDTANRYLLMRVSTDNGSTFIATSYIGMTGNVAGTKLALANSFVFGPINQAVGSTNSGVMMLTGYQDASTVHANGGGDQVGETNGAWHATGSCITGSGSIDAIRLLLHSTGNFDAGTYALYGVL